MIYYAPFLLIFTFLGHVAYPRRAIALILVSRWRIAQASASIRRRAACSHYTDGSPLTFKRLPSAASHPGEATNRLTPALHCLGDTQSETSSIGKLCKVPKLEAATAETEGHQSPA